MPTTDLNRNIFSVSASAGAREWASFEGAAITTFRTDAELRRGINLDLGLDAVANLDGQFRRYLAGELEAEARGTLRIRGQIQTPLNLFKESGVAVRLQAVAEFAAGASLSLGLSVGDFLELVKRDPAMKGLPYRLFELFLEEVTIEAGVYAKAALSAMAYANLAITGSLVSTSQQKPGFNIVAEAGAGLKAGAGYRVFARVDIDDARRFIGRTTDLVVDETIADIRDRLPETESQLRALLDATRAPAKIALRTAYEMGELVSTRSVPANKTGQSVVAQRCLQVVLEESQRFLLDRLLAAGFVELECGLSRMGLMEEDWAGLETLRTQLGERLRRMPGDPFAATTEAVDFWENVVDDMVRLFDQLLGASDWSESLRTSISILWSAAELMFAATRRMLDASSTAAAINLAPGAVHAAFTGPVDSTPPVWVREYINAVLGRNASDALRREDLVIFLTEDVVFDLAVAAVPEVDRYLQVFESVFGDRRQFMRQVLGNLGAIKFGARGSIDTTQTLAALTTPLKTFLHTTIRQHLAPAVRPHLQGRGDLMLYFDEVILPSMSMAFDVAFDRAQKWTSGTVDRDALTEALSSVVMSMVGRSLVVTTDVLVTTAREELRRLFLDLADAVDDPGGFADVLQRIAPTMDHDDMVETAKEVLEIGGEAFRPLPGPTRATIRQLLYDVMGAAVSADPAGYVASLEDPMLMPSQEATMKLAEELGKTAVQNLSDFVIETLRRVARLVLDEIEEQIEKFVKVVEGWVHDVQQAVVLARNTLQALLQDAARLIKELQQRLNEVVDKVQDLLGLFAQPSFRLSLKDRIVKELIVPAEVELNKNVIYTDLLPTEIKVVAHNTMREAVALAVDSPITAPLWNALSAISLEINQIISSVRSFDPYRGIGGQLRDLIIRRVEDAVWNAVGPNPGIDLRFSVAWTTPTFLFVPEIHHSFQIDLGRIELPIHDLVRVLRAFLEPLAALDAIVQPLASAIAAMFQTEAQVTQKNIAADQARVNVAEVERIDAELRDNVVTYLDAVIVEPAPGGLYDTDIPLRIDIAGAPLSFLGRNLGEQKRAVVWVNHKVVDISTFQAQIVDSRPANTSVTTLPQPAVNTLYVTTPPPVIPRLDTTAGRAALGPLDMQAVPSGLEASTLPGMNRARLAPVVATQTMAQVAGAHLSAPTISSPLRRAASREHLVVGSRDGIHPTVSQPPVAEIPLGTRPEPADVQMLDTASIPVLRLTGKLPLNSLNDGINSIAVAITDGMGRRIEKAASFIVSPPLASATPGVDVMLPEEMLAGDMHLVKWGPRPQVPEAVQPGTIYISRAGRAAVLRDNIDIIDQMRAIVPVGV